MEDKAGSQKLGGFDLFLKKKNAKHPNEGLRKEFLNGNFVISIPNIKSKGFKMFF